MARDEEALIAIPKINPVTFNSYASTFFNTYLTGLPPADLLALCAALIPFQTWTNVTASRAFSVQYTNTGALPIAVSVTLRRPAGSGGGHLEHNFGGGWKDIDYKYVTNSQPFVLKGIVPPGGVFMVEADAGTNIDAWYELS